MKKLIFILLLISTLAYGDNDVTSSGSTTNTQSNTTGSNTAITGGYNSETTNSYATGSSNNTNTTNTTNAYTGDSRTVAAASAPAMSNFSQDVCSVAITGGVQTFGLGLSAGASKRDLNCERLKLAKALHDMNMRVASVALLCQDKRIFMAMQHAGTSCPYLGAIGAEAQAKWEKYGKLRPDYDEYVKSLKIVKKIDKKIAQENEKLFEEAGVIDENGVADINGDLYYPEQ